MPPRLITDRIVPPSPDIGGVDLREVVMVDGRNAYDRYQELAAKPSPNARTVKDAVGRIIKTASYQRAPDGEAGTRGTKLWMLSGLLAKYRQAAAQRLRADANVRQALSQKQRDVAAHYAASKTTKAQASPLADIGKAFGVDLGGLASVGN